MTSRDFCFWLQGMFEIGNPQSLGTEQVETIKKHLDMVFIHEIDPSMGNKKKQDALDLAHGHGRPPHGGDPNARC